MPKVFKKSQKTLLWGHFGPFLPNLGKNEFAWKKRAQSVFKYSNHLPMRHKSEKNK